MQAAAGPAGKERERPPAAEMRAGLSRTGRLSKSSIPKKGVPYVRTPQENHHQLPVRQGQKG
jgi:hypothetical protein